MLLSGIHHLTVLASDPKRNAAFYTDVLGLRMVKRTVNFDAPDVYHLYYADAQGTPGTLMTVFPFPQAARGKRGSGEVSAIAWHVPASSRDYWIRRLAEKGVGFDGPATRFGQEVVTLLDPDGLKLELVFSADPPKVVTWNPSVVPAEHQLRTFHGVTFSLQNADPSLALLSTIMGARSVGTEGVRHRYALGEGTEAAMIDLIVDANLPWARQSAGSVHHIAWRVKTDEEHGAWRERLLAADVRVTEIVDRKYFHSIYFREPGGILCEIATDPPGMNVDEDWSELGSKLQLPPWYESDRKRIESVLPVLD
ncbi:MAG: ring-cleaving dioxygenase [Bacteroidetes bacterium]|nr:ring-cleaving dioxygenase [Bacteroidota bacterium]